MSKGATKFGKHTIEHALDCAFAMNTWGDSIFPILVTQVDNGDIKTSKEFEALFDSACANWKAVRELEDIPHVSVLRTSISAINKALEYKISFFDEDGTMKTRNAIENEWKESNSNPVRTLAISRKRYLRTLEKAIEADRTSALAEANAMVREIYKLTKDKT